MVSSFVGFLLAVIFIGCDPKLPTETSIPINGAVYHAIRPDGSHQSYFDVVVGPGFSGKLPDDVESITVEGPNGELPIGKKASITIHNGEPCNRNLQGQSYNPDLAITCLVDIKII